VGAVCAFHTTIKFGQAVWQDEEANAFLVAGLFKPRHASLAQLLEDVVATNVDAVGGEVCLSIL